MDLSIAEETGLLEPGNEAENASLVTKPQVILKTDQIVGIGAQVFLPQLHDGMGWLAGARITQAHRLHWSKAQRVAAAARDLLDRKAGFEVVQLFPVPLLDRLR